MSVQVGVRIDERGAAIVTAEHDAEGGVLVVAIEQLPFDVDATADRLADLLDQLDRPQFVLDSDAVGEALWGVLFDEEREVRGMIATRERHKDNAPVGVLYQGQGKDRQELATDLVMATSRKTLHFAPDLPLMDRMVDALAGYRRQVKEDGLIGSELVVALALAIQPRLLPVRNQAFLA